MRASLLVLFGLLLVGALTGLVWRAARAVALHWRIVLVVVMGLLLAGCAVSRAAAYHHYAGFAIWDCDETHLSRSCGWTLWATRP